MENLKIRCKSCNKEIEGNPSKTITCGCPNMATIRDNNKITSLDLSQIVMMNGINRKSTTSVLKNEDLMWQEDRRKRKIRKLDFEVR